ncbi:60S ribosomal protein L29 [Orbilia oligospora]|uniref:60S ribosomal protein L29 n=1 Tax=Orbilia oligospora TaxID=2813651 RepID=A0A8H8V7K2_ORBOL|nr:60S ribosomal protein L29 [Orbilia oligospora]TGJ74100.1 60S ribosomal protein L29 [Orbilia oligospora]
MRHLQDIGHHHLHIPTPNEPIIHEVTVFDHISSQWPSKNSSQHNQSRKAHRNGIKKPKTFRYPSLKGTDPKFKRNHKHALHGTAKALKEFKAGLRETA